MIEVIYLVLFLAAVFSLGKRLFRLLRCKVSFFEEFVFSIALGLVAISLITFLLGVLGLIYKIIFYLIFLVLLFFFIFDLSCFYKKISKKSFHLKFDLDCILIFLLVFLVIINIIPAMAPPWGFDVTGYHLAAPKIYIENHAITYLPQISRSNLPFFAEMLYLFAMVLKNAIFSNLIAYSFSIFLALGLISFSMRFFNKRVGLISAIILLTIPIVMEIMTETETDIQSALFCFLAFYSFVVWYTKLKTNWLILSGIMMGAAFSTKYLAILMYIPLLLLLLVRLYTLKKKIITKLFYVIVFCVVPLLIFLPWMIKSYIYTGNPVFPLLYNIFGGKYLSAQIAENFKEMTRVGFGVSFKSFLFLFWNMTMFPIRFWSIMGIGPVFLAFIPLLVLVYKKNKTLNILLIVSFLSITSFFLANVQHSRYALYIPFLSIISAFVINKLLDIKSKIFIVFLSLLLLSNLIFNLALWSGMNLKTFPIVFGFESKHQFYDKLKDHNLYDVSQFINRETPLNSKILLVGDGRGFFLDRSYVPISLKYSSYINFSAFEDENDLLARLDELKITHIIINNNFKGETYESFDKEIVFYTKEIDGILVNVTSKHAVKIYDKKGIEAFELK